MTLMTYVHNFEIGKDNYILKKMYTYCSTSYNNESVNIIMNNHTASFIKN